MSGFNLIKPYFRARIAALGATFGKEWTDTFNASNIPATLIDGAWHIETGDSTGTSKNQADQVTRCSVRIQAFFKGYREVEAGFEKAETAAKTLMESAVKAENATVGTAELKNIEFVGKSVLAADKSNDNLVLLTLDFNALLVFNT